MSKYISGKSGMSDVYIIGTPSAKMRRLIRRADGWSLPLMLVKHSDFKPKPSRSVEKWAFSVLWAVVTGSLAFLAGTVSSDGYQHTTSMSFICVSVAMLGALAVLLGLLRWLYWQAGRAMRKLVRPASYWQDKLAELPNVERPSMCGRPAIDALGGDVWFARYAGKYGDLIDAYLQDPNVLGLEARLKDKNVTDSVLRCTATVELKRLAKGNVCDLVAELETAKTEAEEAKVKARLSLATASAIQANDELARYLQNEIAPIVTTGDIILRDKKA